MDRGKIPPRPIPSRLTHKKGSKRGNIVMANKPMALRTKLKKIQGLRSVFKSARTEILAAPISWVNRNTVSNRPASFADQPREIYRGDIQDNTE